MTTRIQKAIDIFLDALNDDVLEKGVCTKCAVGNLVANGMGISNKKLKNTILCNNSHWTTLFYTGKDKQMVFDKDQLEESEYNLAMENVESTDFTLKELMLIENTFETNTKIGPLDHGLYTKKEIREDQINGLKAVIEVMLTFDEQVDNVDKVFTEKAELISII